jgi:transposase
MSLALESKRDLIRQLLTKGESISEVAIRIGTSKSYVYNIRKNSSTKSSNFVPVVMQSETPQSTCDGEFDPVWLGQFIGAFLKEIK